MRSLLLLCSLALACNRAPEPTSASQPQSGAPAKPIDAAAPSIDPVDVMLVIDLSKSMEEKDIPPSRMAAMQRAMKRFIDGAKPRDRYGIVIFAQQTKLHDSLTDDKKALHDAIAGLRIGDVPELGTALGDGLALAVEELGKATRKHPAIVLLADGENNWVTKYDPDQATELAKARKIPVHTVLVGSEHADQLGGMSTDPKQLTAIAAATGGTFYLANDVAAFDRALDEIHDKLEALARSAP